MTENNFQIESAAVSDKGLSEKRPQNEDSFLEMNERGLFAVADGVGGAQAGDVASQMAVEILGEAFVNLGAGGDAEEMMKIAIERANEAIYQMSHDLAQLSTMATTIVALHVAGNIATIGHVGDSRLYRLDARGNLYRETQDHSVVEEELRAGRLTAEQAATHPSRNVISRALGADYSVEVDMKTIMFDANTTFLLCSDGITRHIDDTQIRELLTSGDAPSIIAQKMKEICYERGAEDNLTAVIAKISDTAAANIFHAKTEALPINDHEEQTVATARATTIAGGVTPAETFPANEARTQELQIPLSEYIGNQTDIKPQTISQPSEIALPVNKPVIVQSDAGKNVAPAAADEIETDVKSYRVGEEDGANSSAFLGKFLTALLWLILGGLLGAGLYHLFLRNNEPSALQITQPQSSNIPLTSFEEARRAVDKNPEQYIFASGAAKPDSAEDFYLLGRANLLKGNFSEAKNMFVQAKDRLAQASDVNSKVLADDIEIGLIIVGVPFAQDEFKKSLNLNNANTNAATNQTP